MFGVKTEEPQEPSPAKSAPRTGSPKKVFFGVEVDDDSPVPAGSPLNDASETTAPEVVATRKKSRTAVVILGLALGAALSVAVTKATELSSARGALRTATTRVTEAQSQVETLNARVTLVEGKLKAQETDKAKLIQALSEKTLALEALQKKGAKTKAVAHAKKASKLRRAKVSLR